MGLWHVLLPALGGYLFLATWNRTKYQTHRDSGYQLFFNSMACGLLLFAVARFLVVSTEGRIPDGIKDWWANLLPFDHSGSLAGVAVIAVAVPKLLNRWHTENNAAYDAARRNGNRIEVLLHDSIGHHQLVEVSMRSGKSYVGYVQASGVGTHGEGDVSLIPVWSGYRDVKTKELCITTDYVPVLLASNGDPEKFLVVVPMDEIVSARTFSPEIYKRFQTTTDP